MGSFSMTCSVSRLGIEEGEPVRVLLVSPNPYPQEASVCGAWFVRSPPVRAIYKDAGTFGQVHPDDKPITDLWLRVLRYDSAQQNAATREDLQIDSLLTDAQPVHIWRDMDEQETAKLQPGDPIKQTTTQLAVIREDVWQHMLKFAMPEHYNPRGGTYGNRLTSDIPHYIAEHEPYMAWIDAHAYRWSARKCWDILLIAFHRRVKTMLGWNEAQQQSIRFVTSQINIFKHAFYQDAGMIPGCRTILQHTPGFTGIVDHLVAYLIDKIRPPDVVLDAVGDLAMVCDVMHDARVAWQPASSLGPQWPDWTAHARFSGMIHQVTLQKLEKLPVDNINLEDNWPAPASLDELRSRHNTRTPTP